MFVLNRVPMPQLKSAANGTYFRFDGIPGLPEFLKQTHFGHGMENQILRGGEKTTPASRGFTVIRSIQRIDVAGNRNRNWNIWGSSFTTPTNTRNIPMMQRPKMIWSSRSSVDVGKLSQLSSCMKGDKTVIAIISSSTVFRSECSKVLLS